MDLIDAEISLGSTWSIMPRYHLIACKWPITPGHEAYVGDDNRIKLNYDVRAFMKAALSS
jgi:hypothetical protein